MTITEFVPELVKVDCDFCGQDKMVLFSTRMRHELNLDTVVCAGCLLVQTNPQPTSSSLGQFYDKFYHLFHKRTGVDSFYVNKSRKAALSRFELIRNFTTLNQALNVLEIGSGAGEFMIKVKQQSNWIIEGIEPGLESYNWCKSLDLHVKNVGIESYSPPHAFDLIASFHVLEHVASPKLFLERCSSMLKDEGILFLEVPNFNSPGTSYDNFLQFPHLYNFTRHTLTNYLGCAGFAPIHIEEAISNLTIIAKKTSGRYPVSINNEKYLKTIAWKKRIYKFTSRVPSWPIIRKIKSLIYIVC